MQFLQKKRIIFICIAVLCLLIGIRTLQMKTPVLEKRTLAEGNYLEILPSDFEITAFEEQDLYYVMKVDYVGDGELPQGNRVQKYSTQNIALQTNLGESVVLEYLQANKSYSKVAFSYLKTAPNSNTIGFNETVNRIIIPDGLKIDAHKNFTSTYAGIVFKGDMIFEKTGNEWKCVSGTVTPSTNDSVALVKDNITDFSWNETTERLEAKVALADVAAVDTVYSGDIVCLVNGAEYEGSVYAERKAGDEYLTLIFPDSENLRSGTGVCITIGVSTLTYGDNQTLSLTGEITFYGYSDGEWLTERYIELQKTVGESVFYERLDLTAIEYVLPNMDAIPDKMFLGWVYDENLYRVGETITLPQEEFIVTIEAKYLAYELLDGASVRYGTSASDSGLRFSAVLEKSSFEENAAYIRTFGVILMPTDQIQPNKEFILDNYNDEKQAQQAYINKEDITFTTTGTFKLNVAIVKMLVANYNRDFSSRAYVIVNYASGADYVWGTKIESRSLYEVASNALKDENKENVFTSAQITLLESYVNSIADIRFDGEMVSIVCAARVPVITSATVAIADNLVTITVETSVTNFYGVLYNGERIRGAGQILGEGILTITILQDGA